MKSWRAAFSSGEMVSPFWIRFCSASAFCRSTLRSAARTQIRPPPIRARATNDTERMRRGMAIPLMKPRVNGGMKNSGTCAGDLEHVDDLVPHRPGEWREVGAVGAGYRAFG